MHSHIAFSCHRTRKQSSLNKELAVKQRCLRIFFSLVQVWLCSRAWNCSKQFTKDTLRSFVVFRGHFPATSHKRFGAKASFNFSVTLLDNCYLSTSNTLVHCTLTRYACKLFDPPLPITSFATYRVALISCSIKAQVIREVILPKKCSSISQCMALTSRLCCHSVCLNQVSKLNFRTSKILLMWINFYRANKIQFQSFRLTKHEHLLNVTSCYRAKPLCFPNELCSVHMAF